MMAQFHPNPSKSSSVSVYRFLFVSLLLVALPLFPSQAPEPINQTVLANLWELLHLLIIGIAVSYGVFGRKSSEIGNPIELRSENSQQFLSGISQVSRFFEEGLSGSVEKRVIQPWNSNSQFIVEKWGNQNPRSLIFPDEKVVSQTWNSQYIRGQSVIVLADDNTALEESGKPNGSVTHNKPLGLPVRSVRSRNVDHDCLESAKSSSIGSWKNLDRRRNGKVRGLAPINLEDKFKESVALPSPVPWRSRSSKLEKVDEIGGAKPSVMHKKHLSAGAFDQLDYLQSQSFWSPIFSDTDPLPSPAEQLSPPTTTIPHNVPNSQKENIVGEKCCCELSAGSEMSLEGNCDEKLKTPTGKNRSGRGNSRMVRSLSESNHVKGGSTRGKSARTFRSKGNVAEDEKMGKIRLNQNMKRESKKWNHDEGEEDQNEDYKEESCDTTNAVETGTTGLEDSAVSSEEGGESEEGEAETVSGNEEVDDHDEEVDRKAGEFIAKFREQIRLQKIASSRGFGGRY